MSQDNDANFANSDCSGGADGGASGGGGGALGSDECTNGHDPSSYHEAAGERSPNLAGDVAASSGGGSGGHAFLTISSPMGIRNVRRRLADMLRGGLAVEVEVHNVNRDDPEEQGEERGDDGGAHGSGRGDGGDGGGDDGDGDGAGGDDGDGDDGDDEGDDGEGDHVVVLGTRKDNDSGSESSSNTEIDLPAFRAKLASGDPASMTAWRSAVFHSSAELGECALAVGRWVEQGILKPAEVDDEMLLCIVRCLEHSSAMFEEEEDLVRVFTFAVGLTEAPECVQRMLERGALRAMIRGLQTLAHLLLDQTEDKEWYETERLVQIYQAFKRLWRACQAWAEGDPRRDSIVDFIFLAVGKWLRGLPLQDVWIGEDDILVFWVLIPLWPDFLDSISAGGGDRNAEMKSRFREVCNYVLWPNDPMVDDGYRLIGHLDLAVGADFSLRFLLHEERFAWVITPATKQRYLQFRVSESARESLREDDDRDGEDSPRPLALVVNRETPLQDLCRQLGVEGYGVERPSLLRGMSVHFASGDASHQEEAVDEGGPWREAIPLVFSELVSPNHGLFEVRDDGEVRTVEPRCCAAELVPDYEAQFELCGMLIGMALVYQAYAPVHFSRCFLKGLFGKPRTVQDVPGLEEQLKLAQASTTEELAALCLTFSVDDAATGRTFELAPNGASTEVVRSNVAEYVRLRTSWELEGRFAPVLPAVRRGLQQVIVPEALAPFAEVVSADELDVMLTGHEINIKDWREHTEYEGYDEDSDIVKWFWSIVESFTAQEREDLWTFVSGSKGVPPGGFGHLTNAAGEPIRFTIAEVKDSPDHLPVAHTCGYQLDLAHYASQEDLANKLRNAMSHRQGFGLA